MNDLRGICTLEEQIAVKTKAFPLRLSHERHDLFAAPDDIGWRNLVCEKKLLPDDYKRKKSFYHN